MDPKAPVFATLGCRLNAYETEAMKDLATRAGVSDAVIVNTCEVTLAIARGSASSPRMKPTSGVLDEWRCGYWLPL